MSEEEKVVPVEGTTTTRLRRVLAWIGLLFCICWSVWFIVLYHDGGFHLAPTLRAIIILPVIASWSLREIRRRR